MDAKTVENGKYLVKDFIEGDESIEYREDYSDMNVEEVNTALQTLLQSNLPDKQKHYLLANSWRINYRVKPPSIEEFLTEEWIGPTATSLYPHVPKILTEYWNPNSPYRHLILGASIGIGKSFISTLSSMYVTTHLWAMRNPKKFFNLSQATSLVHAMISFTQEKAQQLLLQPFYQILLSSKKFHRVRQEERLNEKQKEMPDQICWTSAGKIGALQFYNDIHYTLASSPQKLLGLNLVSAILSEISFFLDQGFSADYIWRIYQDSKARVRSRFEDKYFSGTIIDSSPNDMEESPIDKFIFSGEAEKNPQNYVVTGPQWEYLPWKFHEWQKTGKTFSVFRGNSQSPAKILTREEERDNYAAEEVIDVPIDVKQLFEENLIKNIKDYCGWPSGSTDKLLREYDVLDKMFTPTLRNIYTYIHAPANQPSEELIWKAIFKEFFVQHKPGKYEFYRAPLEYRYIHVDQAETGDQAGISCVHPEVDMDGNTIYVTDFTIAIDPGKDRINLNAIRLFFEDLRDKGSLPIKLITFDQYQSSTTIEYLKEKGFNVERLSVDRDRNPYHVYLSLIKNKRIRAGRNIILKNNIKSLQEITTQSGKKKIDHLKGKTIKDDGANWQQSMMGMNAKDLSDAHCGAVWNAVHNFVGIPRHQWVDIDDEDAERGIHLSKKKQQEKQVEAIKKTMEKEFHAKYGLYIPT